MPRVRGHDVRAVAAVLVDAQAAGGDGAHVVFFCEARRAGAATEPGVDNPQIADFDALGVGAEFDDAADDFVAHGKRQGHAAIGQRHLLTAADVVVALPDMQVGVADAAMRDLQQDFGALGFGGGQLDFLEGLPIFDDGPGAHVRSPVF